MKIKKSSNIFIFFIFFIFIFLGEATAENAENIVTSDSAISSVVVYKNKAQVVRTVDLSALNLKKGVNKIIFSNLPVSTDLNSLKVQLKGEWKIVDLTLEKEKSLLAEELQKIDTEIEEKKQVLKTTEADLEIVKAKIALLKSMELSPEMNTDGTNFVKILNNFEENLRVEFSKRERLEKKVVELNKAILVLIAEKEKTETENKNLEIVVRLEIEEMIGEENLHLLYVVDEIGWDVEYDVRVLLDSNELEIFSYVNMWQNSGEDWENVDLAVHTGSIKNKFFPEMQPWKITVEDFVNNKVDFKKNLVTEGELNFLCNIGPGKKLVSDGKEQRFSLNTQVFPVEYKYVVFPHVSGAVFSKVQLNNNTDVPYLPGKAKIFLGIDYVGEGKIPFTNPFDKIEIFIDQNDDILVNKRLLSEDLIEEGILKTEKKHIFKYQIFFKNLSEKHSIRILEIIDNFPVSSEQMEINVTGIDIKPTEIDRNNGLIKWDVELFPQAEGEINYSLVIKAKGR